MFFTVIRNNFDGDASEEKHGEMTPAGGYKAEEGIDAVAFQLPLLFGSHFYHRNIKI